MTSKYMDEINLLWLSATRLEDTFTRAKIKENPNTIWRTPPQIAFLIYRRRRLNGTRLSEEVGLAPSTEAIQ